jgi:hypothetical protein
MKKEGGKKNLAQTLRGARRACAFRMLRAAGVLVAQGRSLLALLVQKYKD